MWLGATLLAGCARQRVTDPAADPQIAAEVSRIRAIDNHAHPVRMQEHGEPADREFDALPVDNMEPSSDPVYLRPDAPGLNDAWQALFAAPRLPDKQQARTRSMSEKGAGYPAWVLARMVWTIRFKCRSYRC